MADLIEYIRWRGDITFSERPFNEVDNLIFSQLSYFAFDGILPEPGHGFMPLSEAGRIFLEHPERGDIPGQDQTKNNEFLKEAAESRRFGEVTVGDYVNHIVTDPSARRTQFSVMLFMLPDRSAYVAYRGTDDTVTGWREDFLISCGVTEAQRLSAIYLESVMVAHPKKDVHTWRVGGHSKGGNLAVFGASLLPDKYQNRIEAIYSNDGPGYAPDIFSDLESGRIHARIHKIVPEYCVIGMLFEDKSVRRYPGKNKEWLTVVKSSEKGMMQHNALSWQVKRESFDTCKTLDTAALRLDDILDRWISSANFDEREAFIGTFFDTMEQFGPNVSDTLNAKPTATTGTLLGGFIKSDEETKAAVSKFFKSVREEMIPIAGKS